MGLLDLFHHFLRSKNAVPVQLSVLRLVLAGEPVGLGHL